MTDKYLTRREAADYLKSQGLPIAASTLAKLVTIGGSPSYRKFGRSTVYQTSDLDAWAAARLGEARTNSSQRAA
jgi:hypothetical protein